MKLYLVQKNGTRIEGDFSMFVTFFNDKDGCTKSNFIIDKEMFGEDFLGTDGAAIDLFISACEDACSINNMYELSTAHDTVGIARSKNGKVEMLNGRFIGIALTEDGNGDLCDSGIVTNMHNAAEVYGACCALSLPGNPEKRNEWSPYIEHLKNSLSGDEENAVKNAAFSPAKMLAGCFVDKTLTVYCNSKAEYEKFEKWLLDKNITLSKSMLSDGWYDITKYIYCDASNYYGTGILVAKAHHIPPKESDMIYDSETFMKIIDGK